MEVWVDYLRARLADEERAAQNYLAEAQRPRDPDPRKGHVRPGRKGMALAEFELFCEFDPRRVLLEVAAKREMLTLVARMDPASKEAWLRLLLAPYARRHDYPAM
jgi:hypothetical protein